VPTILIVEDDELNRDSLRRLLRRRGFDIEIAMNGLQGVEAAKSTNPDLILMDMSLPEIDGWEATRRIRADGGRRVPIIALTAHAMAADRDRAIEAGCDDYDTKPIDLDRLLPKIQALLGTTEQR
jgi:CheY-like chemotaxis protein